MFLLNDEILRSEYFPDTLYDKLSDMVSEFMDNQDVKESSKELYRRTLRRFFDWLDMTNRGLESLERADIIRYKDNLLLRCLSPLTVSSYITVVRKFFAWTEECDIHPNIARDVKSPQRKQTFYKQALTPEKSKELLDYFLQKGEREFALANLLIRTGLRAIEVARANVGDVKWWYGKTVLWVHGKGRDSKDSFVILTDKSYAPIWGYLMKRGFPKNGEPLFVSNSRNSKNQRLTTRTISGIIKEGLNAIGLTGKEFTAHSLRHTAAVNILRAGGRVEDAQHVLRHSTPTTTQIYVETIKEEMRVRHAPEELIDKVI